jgi:uncharacterized membrane protein
MDKRYRSILKAASWRLLGTIDTIAITYCVTGRINAALTVGGIESITKVILYYAHERAWNWTNIGRRDTMK